MILLLAALVLLASDGPLEFGRMELEDALREGGFESRSGDVEIRVKGEGEPEGFSMLFQNGKAFIEASDEVGAMYGALEMAERVRHRGKDAWFGHKVTRKPYLKDRGLNVFLTLPWDYEKNDTDYDLEALTDPARWWFHNDDYWRTLLDRMARCRLNWLDLHGTWDVSVTNAPNLYAYFIQSDKYPEIGVPANIKAANLERLNRVIEMAHDRGVRVSLMAYEAKIRIPQNPNPPYEDTESLAFDYTREAVEKMIRACPGLDAIGFRIGESGRSGEFFRCYLEAVERSGRDVPLITRSWVTRKAKVVPLARGAKDFTVEIKYNGEHWAAPYLIAGGRAAGWYSYSFEDYLSDSGSAPAKKTWPGHAVEGGGKWPDQPYKIVWQVRANGTHRIFPFFEPEWVRRSIRAMKVGTASGFTVEPFNAYYPASPRYYLASAEDQVHDWIHQRDADYLMLWGRLGYDPDMSAELFEAGMSLPKAWKAASRIIPLAFCAYSLGPDHRSHAPELEWGGDTGNFIDREPFDSHAFMSMKEAFALEATGGRDGRMRPWEAAFLLDGYTQEVRSCLEKEGPRFKEKKQSRELAAALTMLSHLGDYYSSRFKGAYYHAMACSSLDRAGEGMAASFMEDALAAWEGLSSSEEADFYKPFTERLRMRTNIFHWRNELSKVRGEYERLKGSEGPRIQAKLPYFADPPETARLSWKMEGEDVVCSVPAQGLTRAWLLHKPLPSSTFFHKVPMEKKGDHFAAAFQRENWGHLVAAEVESGRDVRRIPCWKEGTPYLVVPSRPGPTPALYSSQEALTFLKPGVLDKEKHGVLFVAQRGWNYHRYFDVPVQRKLLDAVGEGMTLIVMQQDYTSGRYPLSWLMKPPRLENRATSLFDPEGALGLQRIEAEGILWQPFVPAEGWEIFGNGGVARQDFGKGRIWMVQARLMQNMHIPGCARALKTLLECGGDEKPVIVVDAGTEGAHYATSVFTDFMNAHDIPFLTLGEVIAQEQGTDCFTPQPGRRWDDGVLMGRGPQIMKAFLEEKVRQRAAGSLPDTREEWEAQRGALKREVMRSLGLDPLPPETPLNAQVTGVLKREGYRIEKIVFYSRPDFPVTAHCYVPEGHEGEKLPVILNPHGHWGWKKSQKEVQTRAAFQASRGYLAMVVDSPGHSFEGDNRIERRWAGVHWDLRLILGPANAHAVYVWDLMRALDYLETRPEADMTRVGVTGTSGGGHATMSTFAADERIDCAIPVCYATSFESNFYNGCGCNHVPGYLQVGDRALWLAVRAPNPVYVLGVDDDWEFPPEGTRLTGEKLKKIWTLYEREKDARWRIFEGKHGYFKEMREAMMGFFDEHLKGEGDGTPVPEPEIDTLPEDSTELLCLPDSIDHALTFRDIARAKLKEAEPRTFEEVVALNGGLPARSPLNFRILEGEATSREGWHVTFEPEPGLTLPGILRLPAGVPKASLVLVSERGKAYALESYPVDRFVQDGYACLMIDVRGFGEMQGLDPKLMAYLGVADAFAMGWDAARAAEAMSRYSSKVAVIGRGTCGAQIALFAGLMYSEVDLVVGISGLRSYEECFLDDVPTYSIQPRAAYSAPLAHLRSLVKSPAVWTYRGDDEPDLPQVLARHLND